MNYKLYQIHLTEAEHNQVNAEGHNSVPKHRLKLDMSFNDCLLYTSDAADE